MNKILSYYTSKSILYLIATILIVGSIFSAIAIYSFNLSDPSFNNSNNNEVTNLMGIQGSYTADLLLQIFGFSSIVFISVLFLWGIELFKNNYIKRWWLKFILFATLVPVLSTILNKIIYPMPLGLNYWGGFAGLLIEDSLKNFKEYNLYINIFIFIYAAFTIPYLLSLKLKYIVNIYKFISKICHSIYRISCFIIEKINFLFAKKEPDNAIDILKEKIFDSNSLKKEPKVSLAKKLSIKTQIPPTSIVKDKKPKIKINNKHGYKLPDLNLLSKAKDKNQNDLSPAILEQIALHLEKVLNDFGVQGNIINVRTGPVVTLFELEPAAGTKSSRVIGLSDDIARSMSAISSRIAVIPGRNVIGIELPNKIRQTVYFRCLLETNEYQNSSSRLPLALGKDISGEPIIADLTKMPHLLVAGTTGSGKSVAINSMILSLLYALSPEQCRFIMIDPKMLELSVYDGIPHLLTPVVTEPGKAVVALKWTVKEMENRYKLMSTLGVRNISGYNKRIEEAIERDEKLERTVQTGFDPDTGRPIMETVPLDMKTLPLIVVIVDEMADLMLVAGKEIESSVQRLAQMARAAGIHIIMATQRPSVDVITGVIKANFPTRISFQVTSRIDSRTILGEQGAENLLGQGDMLFMSGGGRIMRVHGPFVDDKEVENVVSYLKTQGEPEYIDDVTATDDDEDNMGFMLNETGNPDDDLYHKAITIIRKDKKISTSYIQRQLRIGYNRAANLIDRMEEDGIISPPNHSGKRQLLVED